MARRIAIDSTKVEVLVGALLLLALVVAVFQSGRQSFPEGTEGRWTVDSARYEGVEVEVAEKVSITDERTMSIRGACNHFGIVLGRPAETVSTMAGCEPFSDEPDPMEVDDALVQAIKTGGTLDEDGETLTFMKGEFRLVLTR